MSRYFDYVYITRQRARDVYGFTHEGSLYGLPAWIREEGPDFVVACPKVTLLQLVAVTLDLLLEAMTYFMPYDACIDTPITFGKAL